MKMPEFSFAKLKELLFVRHRFWIILAVLFCASQVVNIWAGMPDFAQWDFVFGFPFAYLYWKDTDGFIYFNLLVMLVDLLIVYLAFRAYLYARYQTGKFELPPEEKERQKKEKEERKLAKEGRKESAPAAADGSEAGSGNPG